MKTVAALELENVRLRAENRVFREASIRVLEALSSAPLSPAALAKVRERVIFALGETDLVEIELRGDSN